MSLAVFSALITPERGREPRDGKCLERLAHPTLSRFMACAVVCVVQGGFMLGNVSLWLVPPIRRVFEAEARDHPGTSIGASMRGLLRIGVWVFPIGLATAFFAAYFLDSLR